MDLSIIILSFNTKRLLQNCLESVFEHTKGIRFEVWVVDNASTDGSVAMVEKKFSQVKLIKNKENLGFAKANNQALRRIKSKYCLLLNSDTVLKENALKKLLSFAEKHSKAGVIGPKILNKDGSAQPSTAPFLTLFRVVLWLLSSDRFLYRSQNKVKQVDWVMGSAFLVKKEVLKKVGLLDEKFFMYIEEQEWCYRIKKAGWQIWFYPETKIYHLVRSSSPNGKQKVIWWIYGGLIYFYQKHFASWQLAVLKFLLGFKAGMVWLIGNSYLKQTYAQAFKLVKNSQKQKNS